MKSFVKFMVSTAGRILRVVAGLVLIGVGVFASGPPSWVLIIIGLIPLAAGLFDFCLLAPLMGYFFSGPRTRVAVNNQSKGA